MIISAVAAKIWYLKNVRFLLGHHVYMHDKITHPLSRNCIWYLRQNVSS